MNRKEAAEDHVVEHHSCEHTQPDQNAHGEGMLIRQLLTDEALERTAGAILPKLRHLPAGFDPEDEAWDIAHAAREALIGEA